MSGTVSTTGKELDPNGVHHPKHYNVHPSGVETIEVIRHLPYDLGAAFKYVVRWREKDGKKDLEKALWYLADLKSHPFITYSSSYAGSVILNVRKYRDTATDEAEALFYDAVLGYMSGSGAAVERMIAQVKNLLEKA
ncbi:DUF3310 containing protein [Stenotrophomonas phage vB_SmaS_DLP_5]|uniref:DUF3310 containing protein n=1 Tax=Stenotrophomonas phage vB_SmaS_DLP_5 TaxID=2044561 RepID=A0A2D2W2I2_9CAUD|nr:nucleotide kinase [Stenotrophomonas phage vB_SmaS_DLP_5]ATS92351.1 DUF3310 containing protein [Stenotrophomonas phage vB_SmaS_DLP_5]